MVTCTIRNPAASVITTDIIMEAKFPCVVGHNGGLQRFDRISSKKNYPIRLMQSSSFNR